jgi:cell wall-associated NlpC family hydrolase
MTSSPRYTTIDWKEQIKEEEKEDNIIIESDKVEPEEKEINNLINQDKVMKLIKKLIGVQYHYGGKDPSGFDCSGFTSYIYRMAININIPPSSSEQYRIGKKVPKNNLLFGDLVFFNTTGRIPSHVGIYTSNNSFAHASTVKGVTISSLNSDYYQKRYIGARRVIFTR